MDKLIVIGASAGAADVLREMCCGLPADFSAGVLIVLQGTVRDINSLPDVLSSVGPLRAEHAINGAPLEAGRIFVARPDHHLVVSRGHVHVTHGPKDNRFRPSVNMLFRSAATAYGPDVIGVVLSGALDDGTLGLWEIKQHGGIAVVQDPAEAMFPSMPRNAIENVEIDYIAGASDLAQLLQRLVPQWNLQGQPSAEQTIEMDRTLSDLTCPECRGTLWRMEHGKIKEFQCRVGHSYTFQSMLEEHAVAQERALWAAAVALEEGAVLGRQAADEESDPEVAHTLDCEAQEKERQAAIVRAIATSPSLLDRKSREGVPAQT